MSRNEDDLFSPFGDFGFTDGPEDINGGGGSTGASTPPPVFSPPPPVETTTIFCADGRLSLNDPSYSCDAYQAFPGEFCSNLSIFLAECNPNEGVSTPPPTITPPPTRSFITVSCCVDDGTGNCASDCTEYSTVDGLCPSVSEGDDFFGALRLIPCDQFRTPPPVIVTPPPVITPPPTSVTPPPVTPETEIFTVYCGPTSGFEDCARYDVTITKNSDSSATRLCSLVSQTTGRTLIPCDPARPITPPPVTPSPVTPPPVVSPPTVGPTPPPTVPVTPPPVAITPPPVTPPPVAIPTWRSCIDGKLYEGTPPSGYRLSSYRGAGGGVCWEPSTDVGFNPSPDGANFTYQRGSSSFPTPFEFEVENPSFGLSYKITFQTNTDYFTVTPREITIDPQSKRKINIEPRRDRLENLGDGLTNFNLRVDIEEI
jgi:hypothetical protein